MTVGECDDDCGMPANHAGWCAPAPKMLAAHRLTGQVSSVLAESAGTKVALSGENYNDLAGELIKELWTNRDACLVVRTWLGSPYEWHRTHWEQLPPDHLEATVERHMVASGFKPTPSAISNLVRLIKLKTIVHAKQGSGHWIDCTTGRCPVGEFGRRYVSFKNGILDLESLDLLAHDSAFFNTYSLGFKYDPTATCPRWERALREWFPGDVESQQHLEEVIAYLVLSGIVLDKIFVWIGCTRAGKGVVARLVGAMLGNGFLTQSLDDLADRFALEDLIGVLVCHLSEAASTRDTRKVVALMKSISGRDYKGTKIKKKGEKSEVNVTLQAKFLMTGNEDLTLTDDSAVIVDRLDVMSWAVSFLDREDASLEPMLGDELSGIFNRVLKAHARLVERGRLVQPAAGEALKEKLRQRAAPAKTWFDTFYEVTGDSRDVVAKSDLTESYQAVCGARTMRAAEMAVDALLPKEVGKSREVFEGIRQRILVGIKVRET